MSGILVKLGLKKPKCSYCEQIAGGEGYYYFCSLVCLMEYVKLGHLDHDVRMAEDAIERGG